MAHTLEAQQQPTTTASRYSSVPSHTDRVSPPPPEANTQDLGEGVEADDVCHNTSVESSHNPPPPLLPPIQFENLFTKYREERKKLFEEMREMEKEQLAEFKRLKAQMCH